MKRGGKALPLGVGLLVFTLLAVYAQLVIWGISITNVDRDFHLRWLQQLGDAMGSGIAYPRWLDAAYGGLGELGYSAYLVYWQLGGWLVNLGVEPWTAIRAFALIAVLASGLMTLLALRRFLPELHALGLALVLAAAPFTWFLFSHFSAFPWHFSLPFALALILCTLEMPKGPGRSLSLAFLTALLVLSHVLVAAMVLLCLGGGVAWASLRRRRLMSDGVADWLLPIVFGLLISGFHLLPLLEARSLVDPASFQDSIWFDWRRAFIFPVVTQFFHAPRWFAVQWVLAGQLLLGFALMAYGARAHWQTFDDARQSKVVVLLVAAGLGLFFASELAYPVFQWLKPFQGVQWPYRFLRVAVLAIPLGLAYSCGDSRLGRLSLVLMGITTLLLLAVLLWRNSSEGTQPDAPKRLLRDIYYVEGSDLKGMGRGWRDYVKHGGLAAECASLALHCEADPSTMHSKVFVLEGAQPVRVRLPMLFAPVWKAEVNGQALALSSAKGSGLIEIDLPAGHHTVTLEFVGLPSQQTGLRSTLVGSMLLTAWVIGQVRHRARREV